MIPLRAGLWAVSNVCIVSRSFFSFLSLLRVFSCFLFNCLQREIMGLRVVWFIMEPFLPSFSTRYQNLFFSASWLRKGSLRIRRNIYFVIIFFFYNFMKRIRSCGAIIWSWTNSLERNLLETSCSFLSKRIKQHLEKRQFSLEELEGNISALEVWISSVEDVGSFCKCITGRDKV